MKNKKVIKVYSEQTHDVVAETVLPDAGDEIDEGHLVRCLVWPIKNVIKHSWRFNIANSRQDKTKKCVQLFRATISGVYGSQNVTWTSKPIPKSLPDTVSIYWTSKIHKKSTHDNEQSENVGKPKWKSEPGWEPDRWEIAPYAEYGRHTYFHFWLGLNRRVIPELPCEGRKSEKWKTP